MKAKDGKPILTFKNQKEFRKWLTLHSQSEGIWLKFYKKASGVKMLDYTQALDVALCFGWIDSQANKFDDQSYIQKFTPRKAKSLWSKANRERVARLIRSKQMAPAGLAQVELAKKDGRWEAAYDSPKNAQPPKEFLSALKKNPKAREFYRTLNRTNTYAIIWRITTAKKPETRKKRIEQIISMLETGRKFH